MKSKGYRPSTQRIPCAKCGHVTKHRRIVSSLSETAQGTILYKWGVCLTCGRENSAYFRAVENGMPVLLKSEPAPVPAGLTAFAKAKRMSHCHYTLTTDNKDFRAITDPLSGHITLALRHICSWADLIDTLIHEELHRAICKVATTSENQDHYIMGRIAFAA